MEIYLMRHAEALPRPDWNGDDAQRPLSDWGRERLEAALPSIKKSNFSPEIVLTSPYVRANETAQMICALWPEKKPVLTPPLSSGASISKFKSVVVDHQDKSSLLLVGHMPDLAHFASALTSDPWLLEEAQMETGAIWALDPGDFKTAWGHGKFIWQRNLPDWKVLA